MAPIRRLFTNAELVTLKRCLVCGWHPRTQWHHKDCPVPKPVTIRRRR